MPVDTVQAPRRSSLKLSLGISIASFAAVIVAVLLSGASADAATCTLSSTAGPTTNWSTAPWTGCGAGYPGQSVAGDIALVNVGGFTLNVDVAIPNSVGLQLNSFSTVVTIPATKSLTLEASSNAGSGGNTMLVQGGTLGVANAATTVSWTGNLHIQSGTFQNPGTFNYSGGGQLLVDAGTIIGAGTTTTTAGIKFNGLGTMTVDGQVINVSSTSNLGTGGNSSLFLNNGAHISNSGYFNLDGDLTVDTNGVGSPRIDNLPGGTLDKDLGSGQMTIKVPVNNQGTMDVSVPGVSLALLNGGTHTGTFAHSGGLSYLFDSQGGVPHIFNAGANFVSGLVILQGGTFTVNTPLTISSFTQSLGTVNGTSKLTIGTTFNWTGGTQSAAGTTELLAGGTANLNGGNVTLDTGRILQIDGGPAATLNYGPTTGLLTINNGSKLQNNGGIINLQNDVSIANSAGTASIVNQTSVTAAQFIKTAGTLSQIQPAFSLTGVGSQIVPNAAGTIQLNGGTPVGLTIGNGATINLAGFNSVIDFHAGTFNLDPISPSVPGGSGIFLLSNTATVNLNGILTLNTAARQDGSSKWVGAGGSNINLLSGTYTWNGGTMDGQNALPAPSLTSTSLGGVNINGVSPSGITNGWKLLSNFGTYNFNPSANAFDISNGAQINNSNGSFNIQNTNGLGITTNGVGSVLFSNGGVVSKISVGNSPINVLYLHNAGTTSVSFGTLQLNGGVTSGNPSTFNVTAPGTLDFHLGTHTLNAGTALNGNGTYLLSGGTLSLFSSFTATNFTETGGILSAASPNSLTVNGALNFNGGSMSGNGVVTSANTGTLNIGAAAPTSLDNGMTLAVNGTAQYNAGATNFLTLKTGSRVAIGSPPATFSFNTASFIGTDGSFGVSFDNSGVVNKNGAGTMQINSPITTGGFVGAGFNVLAGTMNLNGGGTTNGPFSVSGGATLAFTGGNLGLSVGTTLNGAGNYLLSAGGTLIDNIALNSPTNFQQTGGTLTDGNPVAFTIGAGSLYKWTGGTQTTSGGGSTAVNGGTLQIDTTSSALTLDARAITINAPPSLLAWIAGTNALSIINGGSISDSGTIDLQSDAPINGGTITVNGGGGTLKKTLSAGTSVISANVTNNGTVSAQAGILALNGAGATTSTGVFDALAGTFLVFTAGTPTISAGSFTGSGTFKIAGATLNLTPNISVANFDIFSGALNGAGNLATTNTFIWDGGSMSGAGTTTINGGTATLSGANGVMTLSRPLVTASGTTTTYNSPSNALNIVYPGGSITNNGTFTLATPVAITLTGAPPAGTFLFTNNSGGVLNGNGSLSIPASNGGALNPGTSPGSMTINSNFAQTATGTLTVDLNGTTAGTLYDQLNVTGSVTLNGTLKAILGYTPANGDTYNVLTFGSRIGDFATYNLPPIPTTPPGTIQHSYTANALQLLAFIPQSDLVVTQVAAPTTILHNQNSTFTITVTNNGPDLASGIAVTDSFSGGTFVSVGATTATCSGTGPVNCTIPSLAPAATETITLVLTGNAVGSLTNTASASTASSNDPNLANNSFTATVTVNTAADLSAAVSGPATTAAATTVSYTVTITNGGPDTITPTVALSVTGGTLVSSAGAGFTCGTPSSCTGSPLANGASTTLTVTATAQSQAGNMVLTATAGPAANDPNLANNTATFTTAVTALADVQISKVSAAPLVAGQQTSYTITVTNAGPSDAAGVSVTDPTPAGLTFVSNSGGCTTAYPCALGTLTAGSTVTITSTYSVSPSASGTITNTATVSSTTADSNGGNNSASQSATVNAVADLQITKTAPGSFVAGQNVSYTITVTNAGPSAATSVSVTDPTPAGLTFVSNSGGCTTAFPCSLGTVNPGATVTITSTYTVSSGASGNITNTATVTSPSTSDPNSGNNSASVTSTVSTSADVQITKSGPASTVAGQSVSYTITVTNAGPSNAAGVTVSDPTPAGLTFVSNSGGCTTPFPCSLGNMNAGATVTITSTYSVPAGASGTITNTATVSSPTADPNAANNTASQTSAVSTSADVQITKTLTSAFVAGQNATYTIAVKNVGPSDAANVTVQDPTPAGMTFVSNSGGCSAPFPCSLGTLTAGSTVSITTTFAVAPGATGSITNTATAASATADPNSANNSASATATVGQTADLSVTKTGPAATTPGSTITYTITVTNNGPSTATNVQLSDPTPSGTTFVSAGSCASFPCSLGTMSAGQSITIQSTYNVQTATPIVNTATVSSSTTDPNSGNNSASVTTGSCPTTAPTLTSPPNGQSNVPTTGTLTWTSTGAAAYNVFLDAGPNGCSKFIATTTSSSLAYGGLLPGTTYSWRVEGLATGCATKSSSCGTFTTQSGCPTAPPVLLAPLNTTVTGSATFSWTAVTGAVDYKLFVNGNLITTTTGTSFGPLSVGNAPVSWSVTAEFASPCGSLQSAVGNFNGCDPTVSPIPSIVAEAAPGQDLVLSFNNVTGAVSFEADESTTPNFAQGTVNTRSLTNNSTRYQHTVTTTTAFYYRVRAIFSCGPGVNSVVVRAVIVILIPEINPNVPVPVGSTAIVQIPVHVAGFPGQNLPFTATLDPKPWLISVTPASGNLPPEGVDLIVSADPTGMPNGTFTGTVIVLVTTPGSGTIANNGVTPVNVPVSISLVTPITPKPAGTPPANALIIPSVGHLDGFNSKWQSDIRVANTSSQSARYQLTFTPDDASKGVKQTIITVDPGVTTALDDIIKTWYGVGVLGENANGVMEIRPAEGSGKGGPSNDVSVSLTAVASSRTYNVASTGTLGQFIPAIAFSNFIGRAADASKVATILGLQQIAQSDAYRTNLGVVEASGQPASVNVSAFDSNGSKLLDFPLDLKGGEQRQLNAFLSQNKITNLADGRLEVKVTGGEGKITTYASVVDNKSGDPLLVSGVPLGQNAFDHFVLAGVADLNTGAAAWRTDARIFNPTTTAQFATLTFYPQNNSGGPQTTSVTINPGEVKKLDNALSSFFGLTNTGGALHVTTASATPLVVTGRTYNLTSNGTFGQFIPAVTSADAVGKNDRALQILQAEDSVRYRTNVGVAEVTGKPATVEVQIFLPDSKISPSTQIPLPANGFIQLPVIQGLGLTNVYNVRISLRVVDGDGKISAYGSVIDQKTQDPTYVPAQ